MVGKLPAPQRVWAHVPPTAPDPVGDQQRRRQAGQEHDGHQQRAGDPSQEADGLEWPLKLVFEQVYQARVQELMRGGPHKVYLRAVNCVRNLL